MQKMINPHPEYQFLNTARDILENGIRTGNRTGTDTKKILGLQHRYNLQEGFPLFTTKKVWFKGIKEELLWFLSGSTNIKPLLKKDVHIWDGDAYRFFLQKTKAHYSFLRQEPPTKEQFLQGVLENKKVNQIVYGEMGPIYGKQWRRFAGETVDGYRIEVIDQIAELVHSIKNNPDSRRHILTAWNPVEVNSVSLPACHTISFWSVLEGKLYCQVVIRSNDWCLGTSFNVASYALFTHMIAQVTNLEVGELIYTVQDAHIYEPHWPVMEEQLTRTPYPFPTLELNPDIKDIDDFKSEDIKVTGYKYHPALKADMVGGA